MLLKSCTFTYFPKGGIVMANVIEVILKKDDGTEERISLDRVTKLQEILQKKVGLNPNQKLIDELYRNAVAHYYRKDPDELTDENLQRCFDYDSTNWTGAGCLLECLDEYCGIGSYVSRLGYATERDLCWESEFYKVLDAIEDFQNNCEKIEKGIQKADFDSVYKKQQKRINDAEKIIYKLIDSNPNFETHDSPNTGEDNPFWWAASKWLSRA